MSNKPDPITDQLRKAIAKAEKRGISRYQLAKITGVSESQLSRIMAGQTEPKITTVERIAAGLGLRVTLHARK